MIALAARMSTSGRFTAVASSLRVRQPLTTRLPFAYCKALHIFLHKPGEVSDFEVFLLLHG